MNSTELAQAMLAWQELQTRADNLKSLISAEVMALGKTQTVGNVRAQYRSGRKSYDYEAAAKGVPTDVVDQYTKTVRKTNWRDLCKDNGLNAPYQQGDPSVNITLKY